MVVHSDVCLFAFSSQGYKGSKGDMGMPGASGDKGATGLPGLPVRLDPDSSVS